MDTVYDSAEYRQAEKALRESEQKYRALVEQSLQGLIVIQDLRIVFANTAFAEISRYTVEELVSLSPEKMEAMVHPEDQALVWGRFRDRLIGKPVPPHYEYRGIRKDGSVCWLEMVASRIEYRGKPAVQAAIADITERKRAEEALRESEERYRRITETITDYIYTVRVEGERAVETRHGAGCVAVTGYTSQEFAADPYLWFDMVAAEDRAAVQDQARRVLAGEAALAIEHRIIRKDGAQRWVRNTPVPHYDAQGRLVAYDGLVQDITQRKQMEEALRETTLTLEAVVQSSPLPVLALNRDGSVKMWNLAAERSLGWSKQEVIGRQNPAVPQELMAESNAMFSRVLEGEGFTGAETRRQRRDGALIDVSISAAPLRDGRGNINGIVAVITDITERKQAEEALRRSEEAYRQLFEQSVDGIVIVAGGRIVRANHAFCAMYRLPLERIVSMNPLDLLHPEERDLGAQRIKGVQSGEFRSRGQIYRAIRPDGSVFWVEVRANLIEWEGEPAFQTMVRDITERKQAEEAVMESEKRFRSIAETASEGIIIFDRHENISYWNVAAKSIFGYSGGETLGKLLDTVVLGEFAQVFRQIMQEVISTGGSDRLGKPIEATGVRKNGSRFPLELSIAAWTVEDTVFFTTIARDITERKQAEKALRQSEEAYRQLFEQSADGIILIVKGRIVRANHAFCAIHGLPVDKLVGMSPVDLIHPEDRSLAIQRIGAIQSGELLSEGYIYRALRADGTVLWVDVRSKRIEWEGESALQTLVRDVTGRKQAEEALRASEERFALAVQGANDGLWDWDIRNNTLYWSPRLKELQGYAADELNDVNIDSFDALLHPDDRERMRTAIKAHLEDRAPYDVEYRSLTKSGEYRWYHARGQALWDEAGNPVRMVGFDSDITERKQAEEALRASEERFILAVRGANDGLWDWDIQNNTLYWSPRLKELLGYAEDELEVDFGVFEAFLHPDDRERIQAAIEAHLKGGGLYDVEERLLTKSGEHRWFRARGQAVWDEGGNPLRVLGFVSDITERRQADEALRESERRFRQLAEENAHLLEQARRDAQAKTRLLQEINHRVKNNLASIIGLLYTEQRYAEDQDPPAYQVAMDHLASRIEGLAQAHDMLSATEWAPVRLDELSRRIIQATLQALPEDKSVRVEVTPSEARVTPKQANSLALALNELTTNTLKHALLDRDTVRIGVQVALDGETIIFEFRNEGPGYPEQVLRGKSHTLGLYLIQNIARHDLRGDVTFHNDPGPVTTFRFKNEVATGEPAQI